MKTFLRASAWVACAATAFTFVSVPVVQAKDAPAFAQTANRVTNKAAADRILREWAEELRKRLDMVKGKSEQ